jgi:hypothetical protein
VGVTGGLQMLPPFMVPPRIQSSHKLPFPGFVHKNPLYVQYILVMFLRDYRFVFGLASVVLASL